MPSDSLYNRLTRLQRITLVLFLIALFNWLMQASTGYVLLGGDLFNVFFVIFLVLLALSMTKPIALYLIGRWKGKQN